MQDRFNAFTVLISTINRCIKKIKTEEMNEFNLKSPHVSCLYYIYKTKSLTAKELCDICAEDKSAISRSLEYLEKNGYLICDSNNKKRYRSHLTLTQKGLAISELIVKKVDNILNIASEGLSEENRTIMYESLLLINNNLEKFCKNNYNDLGEK